MASAPSFDRAGLSTGPLTGRMASARLPPVKARLDTPQANRLPLLALIAALLLPFLAFPARPSSAAPAAPAAPAAFADSAFNRLWETTDGPVADGEVQRSWYWGPQPGKALSETYTGSKTGKRLVQYFDKARMEINNPGGDKSSQWYVTTGLLVAEMVSGKTQVGDKQMVPARAAEIAVGGDGLETDADAPTYTSFRAVASLRGPGDNRAPDRTGQKASATIDRAGRVGDDPALGLYSGAKLAAYSDVLGHNIPQAMWDFLNLKGVVRENGADVKNQTIANWIFVMGYPITEPYWARVKIGGVYQYALFQMYERRSLAYVPAMPKGWQVQMGNVGAHYYEWIYGGALPASLALAPTATPRTDLPSPVDAVLSPTAAQVGTPLNVNISGMRAGEGIVSWFTGPDGKTTGAPSNLTAGPDGKVNNISISTIGMAPGQWAVTYHGKSSNHESIAYFRLTPSGSPVATGTATRTTAPASTPISGNPSYTPTPTRPAATPTPPPAPLGSATPTPTFPPVPTEPPGGLLLSVQPGYGPPNGTFAFSARGLAPNESLQVTFTDPTGATVYPNGTNNGQYTADASGQVQITLQPDTAFPSAPLGTWLFEVDGLTSGQQGVVGFTLR